MVVVVVVIVVQVDVTAECVLVPQRTQFGLHGLDPTTEITRRLTVRDTVSFSNTFMRYYVSTSTITFDKSESAELVLSSALSAPLSVLKFRGLGSLEGSVRCLSFLGCSGPSRSSSVGRGPWMSATTGASWRWFLLVRRSISRSSDRFLSSSASRA